MLRVRDFLLIFIGALGILISVSLISSQSDRTQRREDREKAAKAQMLHERRVREAQLRALDEKRLRAAQKAEEEQTQREREAQARLRLEQLEHLRQRGVRGVSLPPDSEQPPDAVGVWLAVRSEPAHTDVFLNWNFLGQTPLWLNGVSLSGLLVVAKDDYQPWFRTIDYQKSDTLSIQLAQEPSYSASRLLIVPSGTFSERTFRLLRLGLIEAGFTIPDVDAIDVFQRVEQEAGGLEHKGFRAWVRGQFQTSHLLKARFHIQHRELGELTGALADTFRSSVETTLDVYDLHTGQFMTEIVATEAAFAPDKTQGVEKAMQAIAARVADQLRTRLRRGE